MKKYIVPQVGIHQTECSTMLALSLQQGSADNSDVLSRKDTEWNIWTESE